jgi:hypothetical protein
MNIRAISLKEIEAFSSVESTQDKQKKFLTSLKQWFHEGITRPEWCFVVEQDDCLIARVVFWNFSQKDNSYIIVGLKLPHDHEDSFMQIGKKLLEESTREVSMNENADFEYRLYSKDNQHVESYRKLFEMCGFVEIQEKERFIKATDSQDSINPQVTFKNLNEVGDEAFIEAIAQVSEKTLDREDRLSIETCGVKQAALDYFETLKSIDFNTDWWQLAFDDHGLIGLVVPQQIGEDQGAINYIGVVPDKRGNGYVNDLLLKGTRVLIDHDMTHIIAEIDVINHPLKKALIKAGYNLDNKMISYKKLLK